MLRSSHPPQTSSRSGIQGRVVVSILSSILKLIEICVASHPLQTSDLQDVLVLRNVANVSVVSSTNLTEI